MTEKEFKKIIEEVEILIECNKVMTDRLYNDSQLEISEIIDLLNADISWLSFNLDCLKTGEKKVLYGTR